MGLLADDIAVLNIGSRNFNNDTRVDHNSFGDDSSSGSWHKSRGSRSHGKGRKNDKGSKHDC